MLVEMYDVGGDAFDTSEGVGFEIANLFLNEPSLEAVIFVDDRNKNSNDSIEIGEE